MQIKASFIWKTRFETEAQDNSEMPYLFHSEFHSESFFMTS